MASPSPSQLSLEKKDGNKAAYLRPHQEASSVTSSDPFPLAAITGAAQQQEAGFEIYPLGDLNTESERKLGKLVLEKYGTEFYILHRCPLAARPFYTMPCYDDSTYSNSFDVFLRGEKIISGEQHIHVHELLVTRAKACGIDLNTISTYIDAFRYGAPARMVDLEQD